MNASRISPAALKATLFWLLLTPGASPSQAPRPGTLTITSTPTGAAITINNQTMRETTKATFVLSAATYNVSVTGTEANLHCTKSVALASNTTLKLHCTAAGWATPPN